jgi:hypothetical protein
MKSENPALRVTIGETGTFDVAHPGLKRRDTRQDQIGRQVVSRADSPEQIGQVLLQWNPIRSFGLCRLSPQLYVWAIVTIDPEVTPFE